MDSPLERIPTELLERIVLHSLHDNLSPSPPHQLPAILSLSRNIHAKLVPNPAFYHQLFALKFDLAAPLRRFSRAHITSGHIAAELKARCSLLRRIRSFNAFPYPPQHDLLHDLWKIHLILLESDGRNEAQLFQYAHLPRFITLWANHYLSEDHPIYPSEDALISLGLHILWRVQDPESTRQRALEYDAHLVHALSPYNIAVFKYASAYVPEIHYDLPVNEQASIPPDSLSATHHVYPVYRPAVNYKASHIASPPPNTVSSTVSHFGLSLRLAPPLASHSALLLFFTYFEVRGIQPNSLTPVTRADRDQTGLQQPSREDLDDHNRHAGTRFVQLSPSDGSSDGSRRFEQDFYRAWGCGNPADSLYPGSSFFKLGSLTGLWEGRMLYPEVDSYQALLTRPDPPETLNQIFLFTSPLKIRIQEWYCPTSHVTLPHDLNEPGEGLKNAWFPRGAHIRQLSDHINIEVDEDQYQYEAYNSSGYLQHEEDDCSYCDEDFDDPDIDEDKNYSYPGAFRPASYDCPKYLDVIITGETDVEHARAWGNYRFHGRIRPFDGLIVMVRESLTPESAGRWIFRGYLNSDQNFVGRWRDGATDPRHPGAIEGSFTLNKRMSS